MTELEIRKHLASLNLKVSSMPDARFMDQKCIPDVLCAVSECVLEYVGRDSNKEFSKNDIWHSAYAQELITSSFSKPDLDADGAKREYDKFFGQPLRLLAYAGVLTIFKRGNTNQYPSKTKMYLNILHCGRETHLYS